MARRLPTIAWITVVWLALWGDVSVGNVLAGAAIGALLLSVVDLPPRRPAVRGVAPVPGLRYAAQFVRDLTVATSQVAVQVFWPVHRLRPAVLEVPMRSADPGLLSLVANTITLTPGTLTLDVDPVRRLLWVHVLHLAEDGADAVIGQAQDLERLGARVLRIDLEDPPAHEEAPR